MATVASPHGQTITHEVPEDSVSPTTILGYLLDAIMVLVQALIYIVMTIAEVLMIYTLPFLLLLGIFPLMFVCGVLVVVLGGILHAFLPM